MIVSDQIGHRMRIKGVPIVTEQLWNTFHNCSVTPQTPSTAGAPTTTVHGEATTGITMIW